ncbi:hypothetical protein [Paenibacillus sp. Marseille-Q4541]|uniref:phage baseplate plug family protein n=1 Tax=Paenibacillus sp. Marseille-Q4541 TaxID=2831522 RepID=UPI001BA76AC9|nr:hypothetical protein [Paenibacillus sp. Marseille-Q4541]
MDEYIDIEKDLIPYQFDIDLEGIIYTFLVDYNTAHDYFTVDLSIADVPIVTGEKMVYAVPLFNNISDSRIPSLQIIPYDLSGSETRVSWGNLGISVFLYLYFEDDEDE